MHTSSTPAEKAPAVLRPDTTDKPRSPGPSGEADKGAAPFDTVFQALSDRSDQSGTVQVASLPEPETTTGAAADSVDDEDDMPGADDTALPRDPDPDATEHAEAELDDTPDRPVELAVPSSSLDRPDVGSRPDQTVRAPLSAALVPGQVTPGRLDGPLPGPATTPDRMPSAVQIQAVEPPANQKPTRADAAARITQMRFMPGVTEPRDESKADNAPRAEMRTIRGAEFARLPGLSGLSMPATAGASPATHGLGAGAAQPGPKLSSLLAASTFGAGTERAGDPDTPLGVESRGTTTSNLAPSTLAALPRSDLPQNMAMQIAAAFQKGGPGMKSGIELRLSPEELGIVRLTFTQSETGVTVNIHAERAETLELLRWNIDTLAQEFLDIGYDSADFTFDRDETGAEDTGQPVNVIETDLGLDITKHEAEARNHTILISDRLDIRL